MNVDQTSNTIKINQHFKTLSQLQILIHIKNNHIHYLKQLNESISKNAYIPPKNNNFIKDINVKITQFQTQAILSDQPKKKQEWVDKKVAKCKVSQHLRFILNENADEEYQNKIEELEIKRNSLYNEINKKLMEDQPYIHEKILKRIKREALKKTKLTTIKELEKIIAEKKNWLSRNKQKINQEAMNKAVQNTVSGNLQKMKDIMNKKILLNNYIYQLLSDEKGIGKMKQKFSNYHKNYEERIKQTLKVMEEQLIVTQLQQCTQQPKVKPFSVQQIQDLNDLRKQAHKALRKPLQTENSTILMNKIKDLQEGIQKLRNKK